MVVPDFELICEIMLVAEGFQDARLLARKFITLYQLCKDLLSKQGHYDWGLRAIKSVLVVAGSLKRSDRKRPEEQVSSTHSTGVAGEEEEEEEEWLVCALCVLLCFCVAMSQVLMRALRDFNLPKIVFDDRPVFMGLITDLFPALDVPRKRDMDLEKAINQAMVVSMTTHSCTCVYVFTVLMYSLFNIVLYCTVMPLSIACVQSLGLQPEEGFILKIVQLQELIDVRHSVFVIGNAGTGKSQVHILIIVCVCVCVCVRACVRACVCSNITVPLSILYV